MFPGYDARCYGWAVNPWSNWTGPKLTLKAGGSLFGQPIRFWGAGATVWGRSGPAKQSLTKSIFATLPVAVVFLALAVAVAIAGHQTPCRHRGA